MKTRRSIASGWGALLALVLLSPACGPRVQTPQIDDSDYIFPDLKRGEVTSKDDKSLRRAWDDVLAGQVAKAEQATSRLLSARPDLRPARVILGFAALRAGRLKDSSSSFESVLAAEPNDVAALVGLASVLRKQGLLDQALPLYSRAERLRPRDSALSRRTSEVKLAVAEAAIARAGSLSAEGKKAEAILMLPRFLK